MGKNNNKKNNKESKGTASSMQIQQAPYPEAFTKNPPPAAANYIPGLMVPGNEALGYRPEYGGGGWAAGLSEYNGPGYNSTDDLKKWYKAMAFTGNQFGISRKDIEWAAAQYDAGNLGAAAGGGSTPQPRMGVGNSAVDPASLYKNIGSINQGLKIGGDNILGKREAGRIARNTGKSYDDVITKALGRGMSIGGGAVKKSNRAYKKSGAGMLSEATNGLSGLDSPLADMRRVTPGKRQMYSGTYELDGNTMPLVESRRGGTNPMSIGGGKGKGGKNRRNKGGGGVATDAGTFGTGIGVSPQSRDYQPMSPEQMKDASTVEGFGALSGGGAGVGGATRLGRAKGRLRQLGIYGKGTSLLGRGLQYGNTLNK